MGKLSPFSNSGGVMSSVKIATWNMNYWQNKRMVNDAWKHYLNEVDADIYLFQEARPTEELIGDRKHLVWEEIGGTRRWGSGIYSKKFEVVKEEFKTDYQGSVVVGNIVVEGISLTLISMYGLMDAYGPTKGYSIPNLHRMLSDLTGILYGKVNGKRNIILGGDLNASIQFDETYGNNSHRLFFDRLEDFGLNSVYKLSRSEEYVQTLRHHHSKKPWQNDYFFISENTLKRYAGYKIIDNEDLRRISDHNILIIEISF